jgi:hypothetical protein
MMMLSGGKRGWDLLEGRCDLMLVEVRLVGVVEMEIEREDVRGVGERVGELGKVFEYIHFVWNLHNVCTEIVSNINNFVLYTRSGQP